MNANLKIQPAVSDNENIVSKNQYPQSDISTLNTRTENKTGSGNYQQLIISPEPEYDLEWCYMTPSPRPCFNFTLVEELRSVYESLHNENSVQRAHKVRYQVMASQVPGVFNLGGDLEYFRNLILTKNKSSLTKYAYACIKTMYAKATLYEKGITHISLVQGDALGGGLEAAISSDVLIAERSAKLGFPDVLFNSFPGIGAYTFLSRKVGTAITERVILSGKLYSAEELYNMGIVDVLAEDGQGELAVVNYIAKENRCNNATQAIRKIRNLHYPISFEQLRTVADIWVDTVSKLSSRDLRMLERLIYKQNIKSNAVA